MGYRRTPFAPEEWYHCFSRGVDKRTVFETPADFDRFTELLYLSNSTETIERGRIQHIPHKEIFAVPRGEPLVAVAAYCLMSNHPHLLLMEKRAGGITKFLHKVFTGYTMYFNIKRQRVGNLFVTPFRSKHVGKDDYLKHVVQYIHLNPAELFERGWKKGVVKDMQALKKKLLGYEYSSAQDYAHGLNKRPEGALLDVGAIEFFKDMPSLKQSVRVAHSYYRETAEEVGKRNQII